MAPVAIAEDTGGSVVFPAMQNHIVGYNPTRGKYPGKGNAPLIVTNDQLGVHAKSVEDVIAFDSALHGLSAEYATANSTILLSDLKIGMPTVGFQVLNCPTYAFNLDRQPGYNPQYFDAYAISGPIRPVLGIRQKVASAKAALEAAGVTVKTTEYADAPIADGSTVLDAGIYGHSVSGKAIDIHIAGLKSVDYNAWVDEFLRAPFSNRHFRQYAERYL